MLKKLITLCAVQLLASPVFASEENIAKRQSATQQIEKLKEHIPVLELQKIVMEYIGNEYVPRMLDQVQIGKASQSQNGMYLIIVGYAEENPYEGAKQKAKIWKFENGTYKLTHEVEVPIIVDNVAISDDGKHIAFEVQAGWRSREIHIWQLRNNTYVESQIEKKLGYCNFLYLEFFGNGKMLGRATHGSINVWQLSDKTHTFVRTRNFTNFDMDSAAFSSDGRYIAAGMNNDSISIWQPLQSDTTPFITLENALGDQSRLPLQVTISPDGKQFAAKKTGVGLFRMKNNSIEPFPQRILINEKYNTLYSIKFSPDSRYIATVTLEWSTAYKTKIDIWKLNPKSLSYEKSALILSEDMDLIGFSPNNSIITVNNKNQLIIWKNQKEQLEQDTGEKIKSAHAQEQTVVTEID